MKPHIATLSIPLLIASCQVSAPVKQTPVVGQIATTANYIAGQEQKNETASLFTPKNYKKQKYWIPAGESTSTNADGSTKTETIQPREVLFDKALEYFAAAPEQQQKDFVYACVSRIDENYLEWLEDYVTGRASIDTGLGILAQGLSAAGTMFQPASTVRVLSGTSTFVQGVNSSIESKFFMSLTVLQQVPAMNKERLAARKALDRYVKGSQFDLMGAIMHLDNLFMAGTQFTALGEKPNAAQEEE